MTTIVIIIGRDLAICNVNILATIRVHYVRVLSGAQDDIIIDTPVRIVGLGSTPDTLDLVISEIRVDVGTGMSSEALLCGKQ